MTDAIQRVHSQGMDLLANLSRSVTDPAAAVEIAKQIVALQVEQEKLRQSYERFEWEKYDREARVAFAKAFEQFKGDAPKILKSKHVNFPNKSGGQTDYWHVELDKACDLLIPALLKVGITHRWKSADIPGGLVRVTCYLRHNLGYEEEGASLAGPSDQSGGKNPIQGVGSSTSYLERYTFLATCGIVPTGMDNDGASTVGIVFNGTDGAGDAWIARIRAAETPSDLMKEWIAAQAEAKKLTPWDYKAMTIFTEARDERSKELKKVQK